MSITIPMRHGATEADLPAEATLAVPHLTRDVLRVFFGMGPSVELEPLRVDKTDVLGLLENGKLASSLLPDLSIINVESVDTIAQRDQLLADGDVQTGDVVVVADAGDGNRATYMLTSGGTWTQTSDGGHQIINGQGGSVIVLSTDDVDEGDTNLYYTDARVATYIASVVNQAGGIAGVDSGGKLSIDVIPASIMRAGDDATRLGSGTATEGELFQADGEGGTAWSNTIDCGTF